jgi:hypothetical protein
LLSVDVPRKPPSTEKLTLPLIVPEVVELTVAVKVTLDPATMVEFEVVTTVVVAAGPAD